MTDLSCTDPSCAEMQLLIQADLDGELRPAEAARVAAHLGACAACTETQARLAGVSARLRQHAARYAASDALRARIIAETRPRRIPSRTTSLRAALALAAGIAAIAFWPHSPDLADAIVAAHIRALQPGHLTDVVSTDEHTVKPWFDGRLPFAPEVRDTKAAPLAGGRLDYLAGRTAAALVYRSGPHVIDVFTWPEQGRDLPPDATSRQGYNIRHWRHAGMALWAVSDLNPAELDAFVDALGR